MFDADYLVIALDADLDIAATPGLAERGNEFYSVAGAARLRAVLPDFTITYVPNRRVVALEATEALGSAAVLDDGRALPCDLFLGIPKHCVPAVVEASGLAENGWIAVNPRTLETKYSGVYAIGDVSNTGTPTGGVFAEGAARAVASSLIARLGGAGQPEPFAGAGTCYVEFGGGQVGRVDVDFFSGPKPTGVLQEPSADLRAEKEQFSVTRRKRWFGS